jgi:hypothetical protein
MNNTNVSRVLRADAIFNFVAGLASQFYLEPVLLLLGWPGTETTVYARVLGSALIGLSLAVWLAAGHPQQSRDIILSGIVAKTLAGVTILYEIFVLGLDLPSPWLLPAAVGVQVLFVLGEAAYLLSSRPAGAAVRLQGEAP